MPNMLPIIVLYIHEIITSIYGGCNVWDYFISKISTHNRKDKLTIYTKRKLHFNTHAILGRLFATSARKQDTLPKFAEQG